MSLVNRGYSDQTDYVPRSNVDYKTVARARQLVSVSLKYHTLIGYGSPNLTGRSD